MNSFSIRDLGGRWTTLSSSDEGILNQLVDGRDSTFDK